MHTNIKAGGKRLNNSLTLQTFIPTCGGVGSPREFKLM